MEALNTHETFQDLAALETPKPSCALVYLKLILIPTLAYAYFVLGFFNILHVKVGLHSIILMGLIYFVALLFARHNAEFGVCAFRQTQSAFQAKLNDYISKNLMRIGNTIKSNASFENFIELHTKNIRNDNYASVGAGIFPTMGILGTFISIALTLPDFSSQTAGALESEISLLLSGVGTAFYVSIYGILLSLWWIFFEKRGLSHFDHEISLLHSACAPSFWTREEIEQAYLQENLQHFEHIGSMFERLSSNDFFERLGKAIEGKFELFDEMLTLEKTAIKRSAEHMKESMQLVALGQEKQRGLLDIHENILQKVQFFNENLNLLHERMTQSQEEMIATNQEILRALKENYPVRQEISNEEVSSLKESLKQIDAETEEIIQKMDALK